MQPDPAPRKRVLVIDDDAHLLEVMKEVLGASGYDVEVARQGFLAGHLVARCQPDAIVVDVLMPGLDGYEVLSLVRRHRGARRIPVVACTALRGEGPERRIRAAGFDGYVRKPIDFPALVEALGRLVA